MRSRRALVIACATALVGAPFAARGQTSMEADLLSLVNGGRPQTLLPHSGLRAAARSHSEEMAGNGHMSHDGAEQRIRAADPDPAEANGPPDDGETGRWCENVAYVSGAPDDEVAQRIYEGWQNSPSHNRCMTDGEMNAAGVGLYFDGKTWWATMELIVDRTPPGSEQESAATSVPEPAPTSEASAEPGASPSEATTEPVPTFDAGALSPDSTGDDPVRASVTDDVPRVASTDGERPAGVPPQSVSYPSRSASHSQSDGGRIAVAAVFFALATAAVVVFRRRAQA